ncbi:hypothetical protein GQ53DRAFT_745076 [Thozetella sp. PMI_491]|nr:hypothetical protein GQ53DRAFT_745076 [Thozetella sp. PMI_491]
MAVNVFGFPIFPQGQKEEEPLFPQFANLPKELRIQIYDNAFPRRVLRFCSKWLDDYSYERLRIEPLGPPLVAQVCSEAWEFAGTRYRRIAYHEAKIRATKRDDQSILAVQPVRTTWFNPGLDVLCINATWHDIAYGAYSGTPTVYNPDKDLHAVNTVAELCATGGSAIYSEIVRSLLPIARLAETVVVRPSLNTSVFRSHDFFPYADPSVFPRLKTVLVTVQRLEWDNTGLLPIPPLKPKWSVRLLDPAISESQTKDQLEAENLGVKYNWAQRLIQEIMHEAQQHIAVWEAEEPLDPSAGNRNIAQEQDKLSKCDAVNLWLRAADYLQYEFTLQENQDRIYHSYREVVNRAQNPRLDAKMAKTRETGGLPQFKPVVMVHKAPII